MEIINIIRLLERSPDIGDGWRKVSSFVMPLLTNTEDTSLIEVEINADGSGRARLTEKGATVSPYLSARYPLHT